MKGAYVTELDNNSNVEELLNDPTEYFHYSYTEMHSMEPGELEALQLAALQTRFAQLYQSVPMVKKLADKQNISHLDKLEDVVPLLFEHTMYKSYPPSLLENNRFDQLTKWLDKLTAHDLSGLDTSGCNGVSDWIKLLEEKTPLKINTSSGTSGTMSFNPSSKEEYRIWGKTWVVNFFQKFGEPGSDPENWVLGIHAVMPGHRHGAKGFIRANDIVLANVCGSEERLHTLYPGRLDEDMMYLAARIRAAKAKGNLDRLKVSPQLLARQKEFEAEQRNMPRDMENFLQTISRDLKGERVFVLTVWNILYDLARQAIEKGISGVFAPDSVIVCGGGAKGLVQPDDWEEVICKFTGVPALTELYGMSEMFASHMKCKHNHFHLMPTVISFLLDPDTSETLPKKGRVTGRYSFYDLLPNSRWGGYISGDEVTINWDGGCPCGAKSAYVEKSIQRYSEKRGGDDKIECAATPEAHAEAMDFLTKFESNI